MKVGLLVVMMCSLFLAGCDGGASRCAADGEKDGRLAGDRDGRIQGKLAGEREGEASGTNRARIAAASGDFGEIYVLPTMLLVGAGIGFGVAIQIMLLRRMRSGRVNEIWAGLLIPGFSFSKSYADWRACSGLPPRQAFRSRA